MDPLTIGLIAGGAYLLSKGAGGAGASGAVPASLAASLSIDQLMQMYHLKRLNDVPPEVMRRFESAYEQVRAAKKGALMLPMGWTEYQPIAGDPGWYLLTDRILPASAWYIGGKDWAGRSAAKTWGPQDIIRQTNVKPKQSAWSSVVGTIAPIIGGVIGTVAGPAGTAAGAAAGKAASGAFSEFADDEFAAFNDHMLGQVKRGPARRHR